MGDITDFIVSKLLVDLRTFFGSQAAGPNMAGFEKKVLEVTWPTAAMKRGVTMVDVRPVHLDRKLIGSLPRGATYSAADPHRTPGSCDSNRKLHPQVSSVLGCLTTAVT